MSKNIDLWIIEKNISESFKEKQTIYKFILSKYLNLDNYPISYNKFGKPAINDQLFFNVSHSANLLLLGVTKTCHIGIDVECTKNRISNGLLIANKFFHENEVKNVNNTFHVSNQFKKLWVIKEAYLKMLGTGLSYGLNNFYVNQQDGYIYDILEKNSTDFNLLWFKNYYFSIVPKFNKIKFHYLTYNLIAP